jgi:hypothetical protein
MNESISTKVMSFGFAAMVTLTIMLSLDALATSEQSAPQIATHSITETACVAPAKAMQS